MPCQFDTQIPLCLGSNLMFTGYTSAWIRVFLRLKLSYGVLISTCRMEVFLRDFVFWG